MAAFDEFTGLDCILASDWNSLAKMPTQRHCWIRACLETLNRNDDVRLITFGKALAPLVIKRTDPYRLAFIGDLIAEPYDVLANDESVDGLAKALVNTGLGINLRRIPADAAIISALRRAYRWRGFVVVEPWKRGCPYIELDDTWREPESHFNAKWRSTFRRRRRKAERIGEVAFEIIAPEPSQVHDLVEEAFAVEAASWKRAAGTAMTVSPWRSSFYRRLGDYAASEGVLRFCFLRIGGKPAAMEYAFECNDRFFGLKIGYDATFDCSPGNLLRLETIRYAAQRGLRSYEFLGNDAPWTYSWTNAVRPMASIRAYPITARGLWLMAHDKLRRTVLKREP
jgi:CelD/BcsL family acetyltransferase involved in cellulose biosynthesis